MAIVLFDASVFRAQFPPYADQLAFPNALLQMYWTNATAYINDCYSKLRKNQLSLALNLMTAHLAYLNVIANAGQNTGLVQGATIDKVSVTLTPPPEVNEWQWWLAQSPYGQQLLALLQVASVGGFFFGGWPTAYALRR